LQKAGMCAGFHLLVRTAAASTLAGSDLSSDVSANYYSCDDDFRQMSRCTTSTVDCSPVAC